MLCVVPFHYTVSSADIAATEEGPQPKVPGEHRPRKSESSPAVSAMHTQRSSLGSSSKKRLSLSKRVKAMSESELSPLVTQQLSPGTPSPLTDFGQPQFAEAESENELFPSSAPQLKTTETQI